MPRLGSKKSRNGCLQCKARRVKCDEQRPCANCTRHNASCSLLTAPPRSSSVDSRQSGTSSRRNTDAPLPQPSVSNGSPTSSTPSSLTSTTYHATPTHPDQVTGGWMQDLELMHHYTAHAFLTMPGIEAAKQIWGYAVPQEGFKYSCLMHGILAFSAHHLAHINSSHSQHYRILASTHQGAAVNGLNQDLSKGDVGPETCHALFACASLITLNAFADSEARSLDALVDIFRLLRGMNVILNSTERLLQKGPFAVLLRPVENPPKPPPLLSSFLVDLQASACDPQPVDYAGGRANATDALREALRYGIEESAHPALRTVMLWPILIDTDCMEALKTRGDPATLKLFRQYCRILEYAGTEWWFLSGWRNVSQQFLLQS